MTKLIKSAFWVEAVHGVNCLLGSTVINKVCQQFTGVQFLIGSSIQNRDIIVVMDTRGDHMEGAVDDGHSPGWFGLNYQTRNSSEIV